MPASFQIGQGVSIRPVSMTGPSLRESEVNPFAGKTGTVSNFHWIAPPSGEVFYLYTVRIDGTSKELVLYEDELTGISKAVHDTRKS